MNGTPSFDLEAYSESIARLIEATGPSVVAVKAAAYRVASGVAFRDNLVAVNNHALKREGGIPVHFADGSEVEATILGREPSVDLAILTLPNGAARPLPIEDDSNLRAGALAVVVGRTIDCGLSASVGILGAVAGKRHTWRGGTLNKFLRLDVNLYPSQSGAAVVSARGRFVGVATPAMLRHSALAVPPETLNRFADEFLKAGRVRRGYLGVGLQPVSIPDHLRSKTPLAGETGLMVMSVEPDTGAERAGLQLGDILVSANGATLLTPQTLQEELRGDIVGGTVKLTALRSGSVIELEANVLERSR